MKVVEAGKGEMEEKNTKEATTVGRAKAAEHAFTALIIAAVAVGCLLS